MIADRLRREFSVEAVFEQITPVYFERPIRTGEAVTELDRFGDHDFWATVGLLVAQRSDRKSVV